MRFYANNKVVIKVCQQNIGINENLCDKYNYAHTYENFPDINNACDIVNCPNHNLLILSILYTSKKPIDFLHLINEIKPNIEKIDSISKSEMYEAADLFNIKLNEICEKIKCAKSEKERIIYEQQADLLSQEERINELLGIDSKLHKYNLSLVLRHYTYLLRFKYAAIDVEKVDMFSDYTREFSKILLKDAAIITKIPKTKPYKECRELTYKHLERKLIPGMLENFADLINFLKSLNYKLYIKKDDTKNAYQEIIRLLKTKEYKKIYDIEPYESILNLVECDIANYFLDRIHSNIIRDFYNNKNIAEELKEKIDSKKVENFIASLKVPLRFVEPNRRQMLNRISDLELVSDMCNFLISLGINNKELFTKNWFYIIINTDKESFNAIKKYYESNIINKTFIINNPGILISRVIYESNIEPLFNQINETINYLRKKSFYFDNVNYEPEILFLDKDLIDKRINILKPYNLKANNYTFLLNHIEYLDCLDLMIEQDIPLYLLKVIALSYDYRKAIKKIVTAKYLNFEYLNSKGLLPDELLTNRGVLNDKNVDDIIFDDVEQYNITINETRKINNPLVDTLNKYYYDELSNCYIFGNNKFSKNKVLRLLSNNMDLDISILYNSILSKMEIEEVKSTLSKIQGNTTKKIVQN